MELLELRGALASERERSEELQAQLDTFAAERAEMEVPQLCGGPSCTSLTPVISVQALRRRVPELEQDAAAAREMTAVERTRSVELGDSCRCEGVCHSQPLGDSA